MKCRVAISFLLAGFLVSAVAAQNPTGQAPEKQTAPEKPAAPTKNDALYFARIAADVARNVQPQSLNGCLAIYIDSQAWASGLNDSDLGPFLKLKEAKPTRSAACLFSQAKDVGICVYFDGDTAFGVAAVKAGSSGKIEGSDISAAYKPVTKEMLKKAEPELRFNPSEVNTDDGQPLPAFLVSTAPKSPS